MTLFCDLDGVLADFDRGYYEAFGVKPDKSTDNPGGMDWNLVREYPDFYAGLPLMKDAVVLWDYIVQYDPVILTGIPKDVPEARRNKAAWVQKYLGSFARAIYCPSKEKSLYCRAGDILIDDWEKYRQLWIDRGGIWITHVNAEQTINALRSMGY